MHLRACHSLGLPPFFFLWIWTLDVCACFGSNKCSRKSVANRRHPRVLHAPPSKPRESVLFIGTQFSILYTKLPRVLLAPPSKPIIVIVIFELYDVMLVNNDDYYIVIEISVI